MRLLRLQIKNFRNFRQIDCQLGPHVVLLGENGAGKSNLLHALRLVLDADLPDTSRYLAEEDFWEGVTPFAGNEIVVSVDLTDYQNDAAVLACLADHEVTAPAGWPTSVARITYRYAPRLSVDKAKVPSTTSEDYEFTVYGRDEQSNIVGHDVRRFLGFRVLHALRDAEGDLRAWRRSPLRPLLEEARDKLDPLALDKVAKQIDAATDALTGEKPLERLETAIQQRLNEMLGKQHTLSPTFGFSATDPRQLVHALRLFMDDKRKRRVADTSLGLANVLYLGLLLLHADQQIAKRATASTILGIEEPEAHLHPQMQRVVFRDLLTKKVPVIVSTHSPNIASVAPVDSLAVLRSDGKESTICSVASSSAFAATEIADLARYLDVTRAEILFGRAIALVEGDAERFLIPAAAQLLPTPARLDEYGISVCSVAGTDFVPYAKLLLSLNIPTVVITDGDEDDAQKDFPGIQRGIAIVHAAGNVSLATNIQSKLSSGNVAGARADLATGGVFVGIRTLEADLLAAGCGPRMKATFKALFPTSRDATVKPFDATALDDAKEAAVVGLVERAGKGRFAQALVPQLLATDIPAYIQSAIQTLVTGCTRA